jgi:hypothetical protein
METNCSCNRTAPVLTERVQRRLDKEHLNVGDEWTFERLTLRVVGITPRNEVVMEFITLMSGNAPAAPLTLTLSITRTLSHLREVGMVRTERSLLDDFNSRYAV